MTYNVKVNLEVDSMEDVLSLFDYVQEFKVLRFKMTEVYTFEFAK